jgi:polyphosphate kinase
MHDFVAAQYRCWNDQLLPELASTASACCNGMSLSEEQRAMARAYFQREVDPLLTPITIDPAHPFPRVLNRALCLAMLLRAKRRSSGPAVLGVLDRAARAAPLRPPGRQ